MNQLSNARLAQILGDHRLVPVGYGFNGFEQDGLVTLHVFVVPPDYLARPGGERLVPVLLTFRGDDSSRWRENLRAALRVTLPDLDTPPS